MRSDIVKASDVELAKRLRPNSCCLTYLRARHVVEATDCWSIHRRQQHRPALCQWISHREGRTAVPAPHPSMEQRWHAYPLRAPNQAAFRPMYSGFRAFNHRPTSDCSNRPSATHDNADSSGPHHIWQRCTASVPNAE